MNKDTNNLVDYPTERTKRFVLEFEKPYKCDKCDVEVQKEKIPSRTQSRGSFILSPSTILRSAVYNISIM